MDATHSSPFELSGGSLALDFVNTWEDRGRLETDKLGAYLDVVAFAAQAGILDRREADSLAAQARKRSGPAAKALATTLELREALYRIFSGQAAGASADRRDLELLSDTAARAAARLRLEPADGSFAWRWNRLESSLDAPLAPIARSAAELLTGADLERVRECDGDRCTWLFLDSSRNRSRRWCSMESCGNRAKARRHYRRSRAIG
jgi:predicted RNA-binding Zn ribbon-like protein